MKVAVFGCLHGQLNDMFNAVQSHENQNNTKIDLIIVCGDCQTIRHQDDLQCLAVPNKYKRLGDFHEYYSGKKKVPQLTIFVGGNHEASNYLMGLPYGGWVCDNFYYLGFASVINYRGLRIGGISGIYNSRNCNRGRYERLPLDDESMRSIYHTRRLDVFRLSLLSNRINQNKANRLDVFMSHDWPARIYEHGDLPQLLRFKPHFREDVNSRNGLGSPLTQPLISKLKPCRWFAAHLHCKFQARVQHNESTATDFLSLNKIEQGRNFVEYLDLTPCSQSDNSCQDELYYDEEWLTIIRKTINLEYKSSNNVPCPSFDDDSAYVPTEEEINETREMMEETGGLKIKRNFCMSEPVIYNREGNAPPSIDEYRTKYFPNPQHIELCSRLGIIDQLANDAPQTSTMTNATPSKKNSSNTLELDDEGCLPYFIDKRPIQ
uniref:Lariat debranching enzyme n=1 Tax=Aceria tosichella TaxID=561515 RepID=A0A6G1S3T7_9ACAR